MKWKINSLNAYPDVDGEVDVVFTAHWDLTATDGEYSGRVYGSQGITHDASEPFTPFADLTEEQVVGWVKAQLDTKAIEENLANQIAEQKAPKQASGLPWATEVPAE